MPYYPDIDIPVSIHLFVGLAFNGGMIGYIVGLYLDRRKRQPAVISIMSEEE